MQPNTNTFYLSARLFRAAFPSILFFSLGFGWPVFYHLGWISFGTLVMFVLADGYMLFNKSVAVSAKRLLPDNLGLGDQITAKLELRLEGSNAFKAFIIDELPYQLRERNFRMETLLKPGSNSLSYQFTPKERGAHAFGQIRIFLSTSLGLLTRRVSVQAANAVPVYPSLQQMHELEMAAFSRVSAQMGAKKYGRIGHSYEFEQIAAYVEGDDYRHINWKATGKRREIMVNQFRDERNQNVYCLISKGRAMKLAFNQMTFLDYAINASLALSNVALKKYDHVGLITFSDKIGTALKASRRSGQIQRIAEALYNERERDLEPSFELLYRSIDRMAGNRSLLLLFVNFENMDMLLRALPILKKINQKHLLITVMFKDVELEYRASTAETTVDQLYETTLAQHFLNEREEMTALLRRQGIRALLTTPQDLSVRVINSYLEMKSKGII